MNRLPSPLPSLVTPQIAISVDVAGSVRAKRAIKDFAGTDEGLLARHLEEFVVNLLSIEGRLVSTLLSDQGLDRRRLMTVKPLGDEVWMCYDIQGLDALGVHTVAARLISCLGMLASTPFELPLNSLRNPEAMPSEAELAKTRFQTLTLDIKAYLDVIRNAYDVSHQRSRLLQKAIGSILNSDPNAPASADVVEEVLGRMLAATRVDIGNNRVVEITRSDLIGVEVDRFFRAARHAKPGLVTIGHELFSLLRISREPTLIRGVERADLYAMSLNHSARLDRMFIRPKDVQLRGLGAYQIHSTATEYALRSLHGRTKRFCRARTIFPRSLLGEQPKRRLAADVRLS